MKIVFWGSSDFSMPSLELLFRSHEITAVITNPDACSGRGMKELRPTPVKQFALMHGIPVLQPSTFKDGLMDLELPKYPADIFVVVSYGIILPERILRMPKFESVNLHASLLPKYRGASPIQAAIANGDKKTGVTVQFMSKEMDRGDIILQSEISIENGENYPSLSARLADSGASLLKEALKLISEGKVLRKKQDDSTATYTKLIRREDGRISFSEQTAVEIYNKLRAFYPWPGIYAEYHNSEVLLHSPNDKSLGIHFTEVLPVEGAQAPAGAIIQADKSGLVIACKEGALRIQKLKPAGKKEMDYISFINGYKPSANRYF